MSKTHTDRTSRSAETARSLTVALLVVVSVVAGAPVFAGTAAAAGTTDIDVSPATVETTAGATQTFTVTVPNASDGVSAYDVDFGVDPTVAQITAVEDLTGGTVDSTIADDGASANINAFNATGTGSVDIVTVTVETVGAGTTTLDVSAAVGEATPAVDPYTIADVTEPEITVTGVAVSLEPTTQAVTTDTTTTYDIVANDVSNGVGFAEFTVASADPSVGAITAAELTVPNPEEFANVETDADGSTADFAAVYDDTQAETPETVTLGTVTVTAADPGTTTLDVSASALGGADGDRYDVSAGPDATFTSLSPATPALSGLDIAGEGADATITAGDTEDVSVTVTNNGDVDDDFSVTLDLDGDTTTQTETVAAGATESVTFTGVTDELNADDYDVTVTAGSATANGTLTVDPTGDGADDDGGGGGGGGGGGTITADFTVAELTPQTIEVQQGESITVNATVESDSIISSTQDVELRVGGEPISTQDVSLSFSDSTTTVAFSDVDLAGIEPGEYEFGVYTSDSSATGTLTITATDGDANADGDDGADGGDGAADGADGDDGASEEADGDEGTDDSTPGFGILAMLTALIVSLGYLTRRT